MFSSDQNEEDRGDAVETTEIAEFESDLTAEDWVAKRRAGELGFGPIFWAVPEPTPTRRRRSTRSGFRAHRRSLQSACASLRPGPSGIALACARLRKISTSR